MNPRMLLFILLSLMAMAWMGCSNDIEKIRGICTKIEDVSKMTNDCNAMSIKLEPLSKEFDELISRTNQTPPSDSERAAYIEATSLCLSAYTEILTGPCNTPEIKKALAGRKAP